MRCWIWVILLVSLAGCGKSFQEADAIYKDEKSRLNELRAICTEEGISRDKATPFNRRDGETDRAYAERHMQQLERFIAEAERNHFQELQEQEQKVKRAYAEREAAK